MRFYKPICQKELDLIRFNKNLSFPKMESQKFIIPIINIVDAREIAKDIATEHGVGYVVEFFINHYQCKFEVQDLNEKINYPILVIEKYSN